MSACNGGQLLSAHCFQGKTYTSPRDSQTPSILRMCVRTCKYCSKPARCAWRKNSCNTASRLLPLLATTNRRDNHPYHPPPLTAPSTTHQDRCKSWSRRYPQLKYCTDHVVGYPSGGWRPHMLAGHRSLCSPLLLCCSVVKAVVVVVLLRSGGCFEPPPPHP